MNILYVWKMNQQCNSYIINYIQCIIQHVRNNNIFRPIFKPILYIIENKIYIRTCVIYLLNKNY